MFLYLTESRRYEWWNHLMVDVFVYNSPTSAQKKSGLKPSKMRELRDRIWTCEVFWKPVIDFSDYYHPHELERAYPRVYDVVMEKLKANLLLEVM